MSGSFTNGVYVVKGMYAGTCTYTTPGVYTVRASVSDEDGGTSAPAYYRSVIVYDPAGGSAMGSGFFTEDGQHTAKTHFTFSAKFVSGASLPNGNVRVRGGPLDFQSTTIEMLVAAGNWAQFWGTGTLNGAAARFRITVVENVSTGREKGADAIRVELWNAAGTTLLYDTQPGAAEDAPVTTAVDGGTIRVRR